MRRAVVALLACALARTAAAEPDLAADAELGMPVPSRGAAPALAGVTWLFGLGGEWLTEQPPIRIDGTIATPRRPSSLFTLSAATVVTSPGRVFWSYSLGGTLGFGAGGAADDPFVAGTMAFVGGGTQLWSLEPLTIGGGVRRRGFVGTAQLVPSIDWISQSFSVGTDHVSGRDHFYALSANVRGCFEYSVLRAFPRNSAVCVYVQPVVYRDGWFDGVGFGVSFAPL
jgi:hypothetical protein